jgi:hypothetical protein
MRRRAHPGAPRWYHWRTLVAPGEFTRRISTFLDTRTLAAVDKLRTEEQPARTRSEWLRAAVREKLRRDRGETA